MSDLEDKTQARASAEDAFMDAAEQLLLTAGHAGVTTRRLAEQAGLNHGLVHYYFGSTTNLLARTLERFTERLIARQRRLYESDRPFREQWRTAMRYLMAADADYQKIWFELQALAWNHEPLKERLRRVDEEWREVLTNALKAPHEQLRIPMPLDALVALVMTFNLGIMAERLTGIETGHAPLIEWIDEWLSS
jgi:AcrR family transcriptional regulator